MSSDQERQEAAARMESARQQAAADLAAAQQAQERLARAVAEIPAR
ncbi:hypothetical protein GCM10009730_57290 [Streptomyces albidochromogenes]|nr:hypothetical protein [Streptomyces albidochromogenes]